MEKLVLSNKMYSHYEYVTEQEFEQTIVQQSANIFGEKSIYIDIKKRIGDSIITIPDGYLIDFSFEADPKLYIIENELASHDPYRHIGAQLLKFAISYKASGRKIKAFILEHLMSNQEAFERVDGYLKNAAYRNIDNFLETIIFEKPVAAIAIIDRSTQELENVLSQLTMSTDIIEFQTFKNHETFIYKFTPFNPELRELEETRHSDLKPEEINTIVVPAKDEGFEKEFLNNKRWFAIRISASMLNRIKYIAAYQIAPVSAITCYAEVASIEKWGNTNKHILYFKGAPVTLNPIQLDKDKKGLAPQAPRYTSIEKVIKAKKLSEVF